MQIVWRDKPRVARVSQIRFKLFFLDFGRILGSPRRRICQCFCVRSIFDSQFGAQIHILESGPANSKKVVASKTGDRTKQQQGLSPNLQLAHQAETVASQTQVSGARDPKSVAGDWKVVNGVQNWWGLINMEISPHLD